MAVAGPAVVRADGRLQDLDRRLMAAPRSLRVLTLAITVILMVAQGLPNVPREYVDFSGTWLDGLQRYESYGPDTVGDRFTARATVNDPWDMFTKARTEQTPVEAATWTKEASAPYPPAALLIEAAFYWLGERTGIGFYGMVLGSAIVFLIASLLYFWRTRWYLFVLLYLNFDYFGWRFVYVQDNTYLILLVVIIGALWLARAGSPVAHAAMALAATIKLSPGAYARNLLAMPRQWAVVYIAILFVGLVVPYFVWDNYLYIYRFGNELKGDTLSAIGAAIVAVPFALTLWYIEARRGFDLEDRVGWGLVPLALFLAFKMNVARHLLVLLLVPDKRGLRNLAAAVGLAVPAIAPGLVAFNSSLAIATAVLVARLYLHLREIGLDVIRDDLSHPARTVRLMLTAPFAGQRARSVRSTNQ